MSRNVRIGAFNIKQLGPTKLKKPGVLDALVEVLTRYDIVFIQEIRDINTNDAINDLLDAVNKSGKGLWQMEISGPLGCDDLLEEEIEMEIARTDDIEGGAPYREKYAYFYRPDTVRVLVTYQWPIETNGFKRPPLIVRFRINQLWDFGFIGIHVRAHKPEAMGEIRKLKSVYDEMNNMWRDEVGGFICFVIGGDLNADEPYVNQKDLKAFRSETPEFDWKIADGVNTMTGTHHAAYDRLIMAGSGGLQKHYVDGSAIVYKYPVEPPLAQEISDHYPVELELR